MQSSAGKSFFTVIPALFPYPPLTISWQNFPFISNCTEKIIVCSETGLYLNKVKNRSAMHTCVAYEIELLFSVWCLIGFLLEELISDYH